jgi:hypothetical protein
VEDDGKGFDPNGGEGVWHDDRGDGEPAAEVGLWSMRERTEALAGRSIGRLLGTRTGQRGGRMHPIGRLTVIHRSSQKVNSASFRFTEFYEVRMYLILGNSSFTHSRKVDVRGVPIRRA